MRKWFVLAVIMAVFFADAGAFGATARASRSIANAGNTTETAKSVGNAVSSGNQPIAARAASRTRTQPVSTASGANSARVATRTTVKSVAPQSTDQSIAQPVTQQQVGSGVVARAGTKQKAVNMGTKITGATENAGIPEECRTAFDGCMDSFCMLANTSGGRCRCDDRSEELDNVLEQIMKLDSQSKTLAEEGVERLKRGDAVDAIYSMAEDAASKVVADQKKNQKNFLDTESKTKSKKLDMSVFNSGVFDTDDLFGGLESDDILQSDLSDKKGASLRSAATKMCVAKVPSQCKEYSSMLQLIYAQKIKSDCVAYENDLKQQKMNSETLLKTAQKAVRDAAAEAYESKNKYKTVGECVIAFKQCMIGEDVCGSGFSKCVIDPTLLTDKSKSSKSYTIETSKSITVEISASTYGALEGSRGFCDSVLAQCVDVNKNDAVWKQFLISVAPELKGAEYAAEDESRRNCAKNVVSCIKEVAAGEGFTEGSDNWYVFTSNPDNVENYCGVKLSQCDAYGDGKMSASVKKFVELSLNAVRADRCTAKIKKLLQDTCGTDYHKCLGFGIPDFKRILPLDSIEMDCSGYDVSKYISGDSKKDLNSIDTIYWYILYVAQGLLLNVNDALQQGCLNAVNSAMVEYCNSTTSCSTSGMDFTGILKQYMGYKLCKGTKCDNKESVYEFPEFTANDATCPRLVAKVNDEQFKDYVGYIGIADEDFSGNRFYPRGKNTAGLNAIEDKMNSLYKNLVDKVKSDPYVAKCISGKNSKNMAFVNLTNSVQSVVAQSIYDTFESQYNEYKEELQSDVDAVNSKINSVYKEANKTCGDQSNSSDTKTSVSDTETSVEEGDKTWKFEPGDVQAESEHCTDLPTAEAKCKCIAYTFFQYDLLQHGGYIGDDEKWEYAFLDGDPVMEDGKCTIKTYRRRSCNVDEYCSIGAGDDNEDEPVKVTFTLKQDFQIKFKKQANDCSEINGASAAGDNDESWTKSALYISDAKGKQQTKICFPMCSDSTKKYRGERTQFKNWWCMLGAAILNNTMVESYSSDGKKAIEYKQKLDD